MALSPRVARCIVVAISSVTSVLLLEATSRFVLQPLQSLGNRPVQPWVMSGGFYGSLEDARDVEGPERYGYHETCGSFLYAGGGEARWDFLFQDRATIAHSTKPLRIFAVGGSVAWGTGASSTETRWYVLLEQKLARELGRPVYIVPAAMGSYVSTQERLVLELAVLPQKPDAVLILDGFNDAIAPAYGARPGDPYNMGSFYGRQLTPGSEWLASWSHLYRRFREGRAAAEVARLQADLVHSPAAYGASVAKVYGENVLAMQKRCKQEGVPCVTFVQPARAMTARRLGRSSGSAVDDLTVAAYDAIREAGLPVVDLTASFDGVGSAFTDPCHFGDAGHAVLAAAMLPACREVLVASVASR